MLYLVFTVDGDWEDYYDPDLSEEKRKPDLERMLFWLDREIKCAGWLTGGRFIHFIHTSPRAREFFLRPEFIAVYRDLVSRQGSVGLHCHEDDPRRAYYSGDEKRMRETIGFMAKALREKGFLPLAYRAGYLSFSTNNIPILEDNKLPLDFSCEPGRYLFHGKIPVSDWRGAPSNFYRMDRADHRRPGQSAVFEVPSAFYVERDGLFKMWRKAKELSHRREAVVVSVLTHSYEFGPFWKRLKIYLALLILRKYGIFMNAEETLARIKEGGGK